MLKQRVILGLGSNIGDRHQHLTRAVEELRKYLDDLRCSSLYESAALLPENAPEGWDKPYLNMAVSGDVNMDAEILLSTIKYIEKYLGRVSGEVWSPRVIDIDILALGQMHINLPNLTIPHAQLLRRDFALIPLAEIEPDYEIFSDVHQEKKTASEWVSHMGYAIHKGLRNIGWFNAS